VRAVALPPAGGATPDAWLPAAHDALGDPGCAGGGDAAGSLVAFRNTCIGETFSSIVPPGWSFRVWSRFAFPRVLEVRGRSPITLRLQYDAGAMTDAEAAAALERMDEVLSGYSSRPDSDHAASTRRSAAHAAA
jgi:hypothetical protein